MPAIECRGLTKRFGSFTALDRLDLMVRENAIFGFLGPNGAGKTTCLRILTGLSRPTEGSATVGGETVGLNCLPLQQRIGFLPEEPAFYSWMTGREFLVFAGGILGMASGEVRRRADELLQIVDLTGAAKRRVGGYSRGMRQRLGMAQALMNRPAVLFLDEPCSALDPVGRAEVLEALTHLKDQATTVFMSSHILADVERVCDEVGIISKGKLIVQAGVQELRERFAPPVIEVEFDEPAAPFVERVKGKPWVEQVSGGGAVVRVVARDVATARRELPSLAAGSGLTLRQYHMMVPTLEEVFIKLTGGGAA